jgi:hypothetical protein
MHNRYKITFLWLLIACKNINFILHISEKRVFSGLSSFFSRFLRFFPLITMHAAQIDHQGDPVEEHPGPRQPSDRQFVAPQTAFQRPNRGFDRGPHRAILGPQALPLRATATSCCQM